jgi:pimeloyl-ACP methyl ester carboxylesterase
MAADISRCDAAIAYDAATVEMIDVGDAVLPLRRFGTGPALLLVHGFPLSGYTWRKLLPSLAQRYSCYVPDLAGMGDSEWGDATDFSWDGHARRLMRLANHFGLRRYSVIAQDTGASFARCLALMDAERVERLALINTEIPGHRPPWIPFYQMLMRRLPSATSAFRVLLRSRIFLRSGMGFGGCFNDLGLIDGDFHAHFVAPCIASAKRTDGMRRYLADLHWDRIDALRQRHAELLMPVLLLWGEDDPTFPAPLARAMAEQMPDCRYVGIAGARLLVHEEQPMLAVQALLPFLAGRT